MDEWRILKGIEGLAGGELGKGRGMTNVQRWRVEGLVDGWRSMEDKREWCIGRGKVRWGRGWRI